MELRIEDRVLFTDHVLVILSTTNGKHPRSSPHLGERIDCVYQKWWNESSSSGLKERREERETVTYPMLSADGYHNGRWIVRCPLPLANYTAVVGLKGHRGDVAGFDWVVEVGNNQTVQSWDMVAYEAALDGENTAVVFVKGLNLRADKASNPNLFSCHFRVGNSELTTEAITAAQEVIRCPLPLDLRTDLGENEGVQITVEKTYNIYRRPGGKGTVHQLVPSIAKLYKTNNKESYKYELCACSMVWNQASFIREWITYHAWLGVQRWFIYDNDSDDGLKEIINELNSENYNVSRHTWPWVKSQEAGFAHCVLRARQQCTWVAFFDVDEFYYFPPPKNGQRAGLGLSDPRPDSLLAVVQNVSSSFPSVAEIRTDCHSFGPSGLKKSPARGLAVGYTCRLRLPERHKSIIRPNGVNESLLNQVHHFRLKKGFVRKTLPRSTVVINHYKYQVWDVFKSKFYRRVSTYVADWQENQNENSRDRAPGLGTEAIEPPNWHLRFCQVWDNRLRDFVLANLADPATGLLPWERSVQ